MLNCLEALERLYDYVDGELSAADRVAVREHLEACRPCLTHFEFEELFGDFVRRRSKVPTVRVEFRERLLVALREEGSKHEAERAGRPTWIWRFAIAATVILALTVGGMWASHTGTRGVDWTRLVVYYEGPVSQPPTSRIQTTDWSQARAFLASHMGAPIAGLVPDHPAGGLKAQSASVQAWNTGQIAQLELATADGSVSLFLGTIRCFPMTTEPKVAVDGRDFRLATIDGMHAVCWEEDGGLMCVMMAKAEFPAMVAWANDVREARRY